MNPKMIEPIVRALTILANMGVQIFVTTHDYFVQQSFAMISEYRTKETIDKEIDVKFISLYKDGETILSESESQLTNLSHNAIMEEFDNLYDREQRLFYEQD